MIMMTDSVEDAYEKLIAGDMTLDQFKVWLALWSVKCMEHYK